MPSISSEPIHHQIRAMSTLIPKHELPSIGTHRHQLARFMPIKGQSEDICPTNLRTSILYGLTEVSRRRTIQPVHFQSGTTPAPMLDQSANHKPIRQSKPNPMIQSQSQIHLPSNCQSKTNRPHSMYLTHNRKWIGTCHANLVANPMSILGQSGNQSRS